MPIVVAKAVFNVGGGRGRRILRGRLTVKMRASYRAAKIRRTVNVDTQQLRSIEGASAWGWSRYASTLALIQERMLKRPLSLQTGFCYTSILEGSLNSQDTSYFFVP
jgi:hypothetical protein